MFGYLLTKMRNMQKECYENININSRCLICKYNEEKLKNIICDKCKANYFQARKNICEFCLSEKGGGDNCEEYNYKKLIKERKKQEVLNAKIQTIFY